MNDVPYTRVTFLSQVKVAKHPFAKGACRYAFYGKQVFAPSPSGPGSSCDIVVKEYIQRASSGEFEADRFYVDMETQTVALKV